MNLAVFGKKVLRVTMTIAICGSMVSCQSAEKSESALLKKEQQTSSKTVPATTKTDPQSQRKLVVYYLHGTFRCPSCNMLERLTKVAVEQGFADQIQKGRVEMKVLNTEESGNEHFVQDYKLYTKSVILSDVKDGKEAKWKNLDQVWQLLGNDAKFIDYVQREVKTYLEG